MSSRDLVRLLNCRRADQDSQSIMEIAAIAVRRQIEKKCTVSGLNFSSATTELVYGSMIGSKMAEKRLLRGCEVEDYLSFSLAPFSVKRTQATKSNADRCRQQEGKEGIP